MKRRTSAAASALLAALMTASLTQPVFVSAAEQPALGAYANEVITLVNEERAIYGLSPLKADPALNAAAQRRAEETVRSFSHTRPDGRSSSTVLDDMGIAWRICGENIAYGYKDAEAVMDGWMHSDGHRANILSTSYEYVGVGVAEYGGVIYCTQVFTGGTAPGKTEGTQQPAISQPITVTVPDAPAPCIGEACTETCPAQSCGDAQGICIGGTCLPASSCPAGNFVSALLCKLTGNC